MPGSLQPSRDDLMGYAVQQAHKIGVPASWFLALLDSESGISQYSSPGVVKTSSAGALGVGQLMPGTAKGLGVDPSDPYQNIEGAARYFGGQLKRFGTPELALSAYNSGPAGSEASGQIEQFPETLAYVDKVRKLERTYAQMLGSSAPDSVVSSPSSPSPGGSAAPPSAGESVEGQQSTFAPSGGVRQSSLDAFSRAGPLADRASNAIAKSQMGRDEFARGMIGLFQPSAGVNTQIPGVNGTAPPGESPPIEYTPGGLVNPVGGPVPTSGFAYVDAEGAPDAGGTKHHAGVDWFGKAGSAVVSPIPGEVVEVKQSRGNSGQVFGGVVKIRGADGKVFVFRHVDPRGVSVGQSVSAGAPIAGISAWESGKPHTHVEVWNTLEGGYNFENMIDPATVFGG